MCALEPSWLALEFEINCNEQLTEDNSKTATGWVGTSGRVGGTHTFLRCKTRELVSGTGRDQSVHIFAAAGIEYVAVIYIVSDKRAIFSAVGMCPAHLSVHLRSATLASRTPSRNLPCSILKTSLVHCKPQSVLQA